MHFSVCLLFMVILLSGQLAWHFNWPFGVFLQSQSDLLMHRSAVSVV